MALHAIRFVPPRHGETVPLRLYTATISRLGDALESVHHMVCRRLAAKLNVRFGEVERTFALNIGGVQAGSVVTPVYVGDKRDLTQYGNHDELFWSEAEAQIDAAVQGDDSLLSIGAAESFASAAELAQSEGYGLGFARGERGAKKTKRLHWVQQVPLEKKGEAFRRFAEKKRSVVATANTFQLIGEIVSLSSRPPSFKIDTPTFGRLSIEASSVVMERVTPLFGKMAIVLVEGIADAEANARELKAQDAFLIPVRKSSVKDWEESRGTHDGPEIWGSEEAGDYLRHLRGKS